MTTQSSELDLSMELYLQFAGALIAGVFWVRTKKFALSTLP